MTYAVADTRLKVNLDTSWNVFGGIGCAIYFSEIDIQLRKINSDSMSKHICRTRHKNMTYAFKLLRIRSAIVL